MTQYIINTNYKEGKYTLRRGYQIFIENGKKYLWLISKNKRTKWRFASSIEDINKLKWLLPNLRL